MKECDIFRGGGVKTYSDPSYIFSGWSGPSAPRIYAPGQKYRLWQIKVQVEVEILKV